MSRWMKAVRISAAWMVLAAILACGEDEDDTPPPPTTTPTAPIQPAPQPIQPQPGPTVAVQQPTMLSVATGFLPDPQTARGQAGGPVQARTMVTDGTDCRGWLPSAPQVNLVLTTDFRNLRIMSHSAQDTTLVIRGPDGRYHCSDDDEGLNPIVSGAFAAGTYSVYVGTYSQGTPASFVLGVSELMSVTPATLGY